MNRFVLNLNNLKKLENFFEKDYRGGLVIDCYKLDFKFVDYKSQFLKIIDYYISHNYFFKILNIPLCFVLGYKRYCHFKKRSGYKHIEICNKCAYLKQCLGPSVQYIDSFGRNEITPVGPKKLFSDLEACIIKILSERDDINTEQMLKISKKYNICATCGDGNELLSIATKLINRNLVARKFYRGQYFWRLIKANNK